MFKTILLLTDTSDDSFHVAKVAVSLAETFQARLVALNVISKAKIHLLRKSSPKLISEIEIDMEEDGWKYLYCVEEMAKDRGILTTVAQSTGVRTELATQRAAAMGVDLIILGRQATQGDFRIAFHEDIHTVIEDSPCPVLVVK